MRTVGAGLSPSSCAYSVLAGETASSDAMIRKDLGVMALNR
jgi:hypothetical protein